MCFAFSLSRMFFQFLHNYCHTYFLLLSVFKEVMTHFHKHLYTHTTMKLHKYINCLWLTLSRSLRRAILLLTSSCARSSFSCSKRMLASCKRRFSRWKEGIESDRERRRKRSDTTCHQSARTPERDR